MRKHGRDRLEIRRGIIDASLRIGRCPLEIREVESAPRVEHEIVRHIAGLGRDDRLQTRSIRLHGHDRASATGNVERRDEETAVPMKGQAARRQPIECHHGRELAILRQTQHTPARHVAEIHIAALVEDRAFEDQPLL